MLTPSNVTLSEYNSALLNEQATHIRIVFPVQNVTFTDDDISANGGITLLQVLNTETDLIMGNAVAEQITINFLNNGQFVGIDWSEEFRVDLGVYINGATEWVTIGYFKGKRPDRVARVETIVFTALDRMQKFDLLADDFVDSLTFPMTMAQIYSALCTYVGVQSIHGNEIADSMALSYAENPFRQGLTCRQILAWIAEANCCYAKIDNNGKVKLVWFTDHTSDYSIDGNSYFNIELAEVTASAPDSVRIASTDQEGVSLLYPLTGVETYQIIDNPFLLDIDYSDKVAFITELLTRFGNITPYIPTNLNAVGNWMVETGDIIEVGYDNGSTMNMPIFARTMQWNGGCEDVYECSGQDKRSEMTESARVTYEEGGKLAQKYTVRSGIDITDAGIQVSGGKYVKIVSGGTFDVDSTNFKINSQYKRIIAGKWQFDDFGMVYFDDDENTGFEIAENDDGATNLSGVYYKYGTDGNLEFGQIIISPGIRSEGVSQKSRFIFQNQYNTETQTMTKYFYPVRRSVDGFISALGSSTTPWDYGYITNLRTESGNVTNLHTDYISCIPDSQYPTKNFTQFTSNIRVDYAHDTYSAFIRVSHNTTSCGVTLISRPNGIHGLQSSGYWNGSSFTPDSKNMVYRDTDGKVYFDGYTIEKSVPSNAVFTDTWNANSKNVAGYVSAPGAVANKVWKTDGSGNPGWRDDDNTWRPVVDNLTSTDTDKSLSANQGKFLNDRKIAIYNRSDIGTSYNIDTLSQNGWFELRDASEATVSGTRPFSGYGGVLNLKTPDNIMQMQLAYKSGGGIFIRGKQSANVSLENVPWYTIPNGIVDNLTSTSTTAALSANQGKVLNEAKANGKQATWLPSNGYNPLTSETGYFCYSTTPNLIPAQGLPTERTTYGIIFGDCSGSYKSMLYMTVLGDLYTYKTNGTQEWLRLALLSEVNAKVSKAGDTMTGRLWLSSDAVIEDRLIGYNSGTGETFLLGKSTQYGILQIKDSGTVKVNIYANSSGGFVSATRHDGLFHLPRITTGNANDSVGSLNAFRIREYGNGSSNIPNANWYHILESRGSDANYDTQLALGMTTNDVYYRNKMSGSWQRYHRLDNSRHEDWSPSITVENCGHAFVLIGHRYRVTVWLPGTAGIDISVTYFNDSGINGFYKESTTNSITFGSTASGTAFTITRSGNSFTMKSTDNTTNRTWTVFQY